MCVHTANPKFISKKGYLAGARLNIPKGYKGSHRNGPLSLQPIVRNIDSLLQVDMSQFWLIPDFSKAAKPNYFAVNARDDKMLYSRMWQPITDRNQRCLIPINAFFEPHTLKSEQVIEGSEKPTNKVPFRIWLKSAEQFYLAGLWNEWEDKETGEVILSHAIITTKANDTLAKIHNAKKRMPVILPETSFDDWLNPDLPTKELHKSGLLSPWPDEDIAFTQITKQFDYKASGEELSKPVMDSIEL